MLLPWPLRAGQDFSVPLFDVRDPSSPSFGPGRGEGSEAGSPVALGWPRRLRAVAPRAAEGGVGGGGLGALRVGGGGGGVRPAADPARFALAAIGTAFGAGCALPGWAGLGPWRFASAVSGGRLIAASTISPWLIVGRRR